MRVYVGGGRYYDDKATLWGFLDSVHDVFSIARLGHGACPYGGADELADLWAVSRGVPCDPFPVDHAVDGPWPGAGPRRNGRGLAAFRPDVVFGFPGGSGTRNMLRQAKAAGIPVVALTTILQHADRPEKP